jgi:putative membrane protein
LLFVSLAERYAEVIADEGIATCVDQSAWDGIVDVLVTHAHKGNVADGFVVAAELSGALLATHFPKTDDDTNELDDHLVEL